MSGTNIIWGFMDLISKQCIWRILFQNIPHYIISTNLQMRIEAQIENFIQVGQTSNKNKIKHILAILFYDFFKLCEEKSFKIILCHFEFYLQLSSPQMIRWGSFD